jgi:hypothetical protein
MRRTSDVSSRLLEGLAIVGPSLSGKCRGYIGSSRRLILPEESFSLAFSKTSGSTLRLNRMVLIVSSIRTSALDRMSRTTSLEYFAECNNSNASPSSQREVCALGMFRSWSQTGIRINSESCPGLLRKSIISSKAQRIG